MSSMLYSVETARRAARLAPFFAFALRLGRAPSGRGRAGAALTRSSPTISRKRSPRCFEVLEGVEAGAGRARAGRPRRAAAAAAARRTASSRSSQRCSSTPASTRRRQLLGQALGGGADQVDGDAALARPGRAAARRARPSRCRRGSRGRRRRRRARPTAAEATLVAFESLTKRTPSISATCSSRCGTPAKLRSPSRTASRSSPIASAAAAAAIALATLCSPSRPSSSTASSGSPS